MRVTEENENGREYWESLWELCEGYRELHAAEPPLERRALSWSRCIAFAQVMLGACGEPVHRGQADDPLVIWVLGTSDEVEGALAANGYFRDASWLDRAATQIVLLGTSLQQMPGHGSGEACSVQVTSYDNVKDVSPPHFAMVFMPDRDHLAFEPGDGLQAGRSAIPREVLALLVGVPIVVSTCFKLPARERSLESLGSLLLLRETTCPFSSSAGDPHAQFSENGWIFAVRGPDALDFAMNLDSQIQKPLPLPEDQRLPALFWGILDLKYDSSKPILERVRVLETGDGRISKFSGDGAAIQELMKSRYMPKESSVVRKFHLISADKKLTHDLMDLAGYTHIVPGQACYPRHYHADLAEQIALDLELQEDDKVVLKLCNRSRAAGVIVAPLDELDEVLEEILVSPPKMEVWLDERTQQQVQVGQFGFTWGCFEEQKRHWWANECPCFVAERWCTSTPVLKEGKLFDGTMRVGFVLLHKKEVSKGVDQKPNSADGPNGGGASDVPIQPEELAVHWLGGYWKLPKQDMGSTELRDRVVSAARTSGTAPVRSSLLAEIYAALGDSVQQLFGGVEPSTKMLAEHYKQQPEIAAYLTARFALSNREQSRMKKMLYDAQVLANKLPEARGKHFTESFIARCYGVLEARSDAKDRWDTAKRHFQKSLKHLQSNANTLYLLGMAALELGKCGDAVSFMSRSLLLDPDFRAPYVNLGVAYLRMKLFEEAIHISEACLDRHPSSPQCQYHIGVAACQLALLIEARGKGGAELPLAEKMLYEHLRRRATECLSTAQSSEEGQKRKPQGNLRLPEPPWLEVDSLMLQAMAVDGLSRTGGYRQETQPLREFRLPPTVGWRIFGWRT
ncbi:unnamed protein product [Effrenium voratum]|uniref:Uncharacterized protein n=1 Tax=Effrenium voratum TaxID=2562239 RepID=A0AA36HPF5_9DINO|nr:unnamed protein product [Effrenium voratum]CAJ1419180.1 unnamed protein product [Effrenium voratum]